MYDIKEFIALVTKMRMLQKEYFRTRSSIVLATCKKAENDVDKFLDLINKPVDDQKKLGL